MTGRDATGSIARRITMTVTMTVLATACPGLPGLPGTPGTPGRTPLEGFVDLHTHPMIHLAFGGKLVHGAVDEQSMLPTNLACVNGLPAGSIAAALGPDSPSHAPGFIDPMNPLLPVNPLGFPCGDTLRAGIILGFQAANHARVTLSPAVGYPVFEQWPKWNDITHQKMWFEWIDRARVGGLRVMVALATNNKTLGDAVSGPLDLPTDDLASGDLQLTAIKDFVLRHPGVMQVASTANEVDMIVRSNRIAVVLGIELDNIGNFNREPALTETMVKHEIRRLFDLGVRYVFPVHIMNNTFGATAIYENGFNTANRRETGSFWKLECAVAADAITHTYAEDNDVLRGAVGLFKLGLDPFDHPPTPPTCAAPLGHRNADGLTTMGQFAIREMMKRGLMIDIDHMSQHSADQTIAIAQGVGYPLLSGHNAIRGMAGGTAENSRSPAQLRQISKLGGMFGLGTDSADAQAWAGLYQAAMAEMGYANADSSQRFYDNGAVALGTDLNGLVKGPAPGGRNNVAYDAEFPMSTTGSKSWDYNVEGVAHYGMLPDFLRDVRTAPANGTPAGVTGAVLVDQHLMRNAEYFFRMWTKIEVLAGAGIMP